MSSVPKDPPGGWAADGLSEFIDSTRRNVFASFAHLRPAYRLLSDVDAGFKLIAENLTNPPDWFVVIFLLRAHSSFLGAAHLSLSGQLPEAYMLLRGSLENAVYGLYFHLKPKSYEPWLRRHDSLAAAKAVRAEFKIAAMLRLIGKIDPPLGSVAQTLYEHTIDFGAHPNERGVTQMLRMTKGEQRRIDLSYLSGHNPPMKLCLRRVAQGGVCDLKLFRHALRERFDLIGLSEQISRLENGL
jgi:hypothetical protein